MLLKNKQGIFSNIFQERISSENAFIMAMSAKGTHKDFSSALNFLLLSCCLASPTFLCEFFLDKSQLHQVSGKTHQYFTLQSLL